MATKNQEKMRSEIINCSKKLFEVYGYTNTSIRMISKEMGFKNQASFYSYFKSKDDMTAVILQKNAQKVQKYIKDLHLTNVSGAHLLLLENLIITEILRDDFNRKFYTEAQVNQSLSQILRQTPGYTQKIYDDYISKDISQITFDELQLNLFAYVKGICGIFQAIDSKETSVPFDQAIKIFPNIFLQFMGVDDHKQDSIIKETHEIFHSIPSEDLISLYFFN